MHAATRAHDSRVCALVAAVLIAVVGGAGACGALENRTTVSDLRVLGIAAAPPEVFIADFDNPGTVTPSSVTALVVDPAGGGRPVTARMTACPYFLDAVTAATGGSAVLCSALPAEARRDFPVTEQVLGIQHTISATVSFDETTAQVFRGASANDRIYGMAVMTEWEITAGTETVTALKRIRYTQPQPDWGQVPNRNPSLIGVRYFHEGLPGLFSQPDPTTFAATAEVSVLPQLSAASIEQNYVTPVATSATDPTPIAKTIEHERIRLAYFATYGTFSPASTSTSPSAIYDPMTADPTPSTYHAPGPGQARPADGFVVIWIVARDERGGAAWTSRLIQIPPL